MASGTPVGGMCVDNPGGMAVRWCLGLNVAAVGICPSGVFLSALRKREKCLWGEETWVGAHLRQESWTQGERITEEFRRSPYTSWETSYPSVGKESWGPVEWSSQKTQQNGAPFLGLAVPDEILLSFGLRPTGLPFPIP